MNDYTSMDKDKEAKISEINQYNSDSLDDDFSFDDINYKTTINFSHTIDNDITDNNLDYEITIENDVTTLTKLAVLLVLVLPSVRCKKDSTTILLKNNSATFSNFKKSTEIN